ITNSSGSSVWSADYEPFGNLNSESGTLTNKLRFPGQYEDSETGNYQNYYRDYDPAYGRYLQSDPVGIRGGLNTYSYVYASPLNFADPTGLSATIFLPRLFWPRPLPFPIDPTVTVPLPNGELPTTGDCKASEWELCWAKCGGPPRGCYVTIRWKIRSARGGRPIRSEEREVNCNCDDGFVCNEPPSIDLDFGKPRFDLST
ncbi:MAG: RHS repeat-associated core domain-containing protein, partial [Xanthomonadales bacterium]|nr:RHS repeat-associated core domain-containing protein [Xanthomonadales bacterium]